MNTLYMICGVSCTLKSSITRELSNRLNSTPVVTGDVNRDYLKVISEITMDPPKTVGEIDLVMLVTNRLINYRNLINESKKLNTDLILNRTIIEHTFFDNKESLPYSIDTDKLIDTERKLYQGYEKVMVLVNNLSNEMLTEFYLTDDNRTSAMFNNGNDLNNYHELKDKYEYYLRQYYNMLEFDKFLKYNIDEDQDISSTALTTLTKKIVENIINEKSL